MHHKLILIGGFLTLFVGLTIPKAEARQSRLLVIAQDLRCAESEQEAKALLEKLSGLSAQPYGIPSDNGQTDESAALFAATVDIVLKVLYDTVQRFPGLQKSVEQTALRWHYCDTFNDGDFADLTGIGDNGIEKHEAIGPFPVRKQGFGVWGFTQKSEKNRYIPEILKSSSMFPRAYQDLAQRLSQTQCFPVVNSEIYSLNQHKSYPGFLRLSEPLQKGIPYPYAWYDECGLKPKPKQLTQHKPTGHSTRAAQPYSQPKNIARNEPLEVTTVLEQPKLARVDTAQKTTGNAKQHGLKKSFSKLKPKKAEKNFLADLIADKYVPPSKGEVPVISTAIPTGGSNMSAPLPLPPADGLGIAGNFYHRAKLTGQMSVGVNASWHPYSYFFARGGLNYTYLPNSGEPSYSWGVGYDDWHPGTYSAQINNWGPIVPGDDPLKGAVANIGYKFIADFLKPYYLTTSASLNLPFTGDPSITSTWVWSPKEHWFVRVSLSTSLTDIGSLNWTYSFGYSDWHPFTFSLIYDNFGNNPLIKSTTGDPFNFIKNGVVTLSWSWAF